MGVVERMGRGTGCAVSLYPLTLPITMREHIRASIARGYIHSDWLRKQIGQGIVVDDLGWPAESGDAALAYQGNSVGPARREIEVVMNGDDDRPFLIGLGQRSDARIQCSLLIADALTQDDPAPDDGPGCRGGHGAHLLSH